jgi:predicted nucleic acid-binding protein
MRTALDSNVLSALWSRGPSAADIVRRLGSAKMEGGLTISAPVYVELLAHPAATESFVNQFLADTGIDIDFLLERPVWLEAGRRFAQYAMRRRKSTHQSPKRLMVDFVIGAHALMRADRLMTLDVQRYKRDFAELTLL